MFHRTHRCHNRAFLLKFALDRDGYRAQLRERSRRFEVALLDYCVTSIHVHLLVDAEDRVEISAWMQQVAGEFARGYNRRKGRSNALWGDNYHATLVEEGTYLLRCLGKKPRSHKGRRECGACARRQLHTVKKRP